MLESYGSKRQSAFEPVLRCSNPIITPPPEGTLCSLLIPQLAEFAASVVFLMWHARKKANHGNVVDAAKPSPAFKKFCLQIMTATRLSQHAVVLALKYICDLLRSHPSIEGAEGSEYRLFTVALILANKFLDDSTFTNKTWSDVSGMKLQDLNTMEAEFLEALGYELFVHRYEFDQWRNALEGCRAHVERMAMEGFQQRDGLVRAVLMRLGLRNVEYPEEDGRKQRYNDDDDDVLFLADRAILETARLNAQRLSFVSQPSPKPSGSYSLPLADLSLSPPMMPAFWDKPAQSPRAGFVLPQPGQQPNTRPVASKSFRPECLYPPFEEALRNMGLDLFSDPWPRQQQPQQQRKYDSYPPGLPEPGSSSWLFEYRPSTWTANAAEPVLTTPPTLTPAWCRIFF